MKKNKFFFTLRDFSKSGGGAIRIKGMINALVMNGISTTLVCKTNQDKIDLSSNILEIDLGFSPLEKKIFLFLLSFNITFFLVNIVFFKKIEKLKDFISENKLYSERMLFCEYIDTSIGYYLKRKELIESYSIDLHGVAHIEFSSSPDISIFRRIYLWIKYKSSISLDHKVILNADKVIYASEMMHQYFLRLYPDILGNKYIVIPYVLNDIITPSVINNELVKSIENKYGIRRGMDIIFFAGAFKKLGGVVDLMKSFNRVLKVKPDAKLFLIGEGVDKEHLVCLVKEYEIEDSVIFAGIIPYDNLSTYQSFASVIVCPDTDNPYSRMIVHLKYFDSLLSGKVVINGSFKSVLEMNHKDKLSVSFTPSSIEDLSKKILFVLNNKTKLEEKYKNTPDYVRSNFTYSHYFPQLLEI